MNNQTRKILFLSCFIVFIIACPALLAYSIGLNFDFNSRKIISTGSVYIKSIPENSDIYVNDVLYGAKTPSYVNSLIEGDYNITIIKEGFSKWQKTLNVKSYQVTSAENILLLPQNPKITQLLTEESKWISLSPSGKKAVVLFKLEESSFLYFLDLSINESAIVSRVDITNKLIYISAPSVKWSADERKISAFGAINNIQKGYLLFDISNPEPKFLAGAQTESQSYWHQENSDIFTYLDGGKIYQLNISNGAMAEIANNVSDYIISGNKTFFIEKTSGLINSASDPWTALSPGGIKISQFAKMPIPNFSSQIEYSLFELSENELLIKDGEDNLFIASEQETRSLAENISGSDISGEKKRILFYNGHEINIYDYDSKSNFLVIRTEQKIKKALWFDDFHIAYLLSDGSFYIAELDGRNGRNILSPLSEKADNFWLKNMAEQNYPILYYFREDRLFKVNWNKKDK